MKRIISFILICLAVAGCSPAVSAAANSTAQIAGAEKTISSAMPLSLTSGPPRLLLVPSNGTPVSSTSTPSSGWKTFISAARQVAVDYPSDWSATEQINGVTFASPSGAVITMQISTASVANAGNQQCTTLITAYGQTANLCLEAGLYSAGFNLQLADGSIKSLMVSTTNSNVLNVYKGMVNSLRPTQ